MVRSGQKTLLADPTRSLCRCATQDTHAMSGDHGGD